MCSDIVYAEYLFLYKVEDGGVQIKIKVVQIRGKVNVKDGLNFCNRLPGLEGGGLCVSLGIAPLLTLFLVGLCPESPPKGIPPLSL